MATVAVDTINEKQTIEIQTRKQNILKLKDVEKLDEENKELFIKKSNKKQLRAILIELGKNTEELVGLDKTQLEMMLEDMLIPLEMEKDVEIESDVEKLTIGEYFSNYIKPSNVKNVYSANVFLNRYIQMRDRFIKNKKNKIEIGNILDKQINRYIRDSCGMREVGVLMECG